MKTIGLLGGTSWPSTIEYYSYLNTQISAKLGNYHSAKILLYSIDYQDIKSNYNTAWEKVKENLEKELQYLASKKPDIILVCNNTLHKALDELSGFSTDIPIIHIGNTAAVEAKRRNMSKVLFLGTKVTMENGYFQTLYENYGLEVIIPTEKERNDIQVIQSKLAAGEMNDSFDDYFETLIDVVYATVDGIILGCTELPLAFRRYKQTHRIINTIHAQCDAAINLVLS